MKKPIALFVALGLAGLVGGAALAAMSPLADDFRRIFERSGGTPEQVHHAATVDGGSWELKSYPNQRGEKCMRQTVPGEAVGMTCFDTATMFANGRDVFVMPGARQRGDAGVRLTWDNMWLHGFVSTRVAELEVVNMDCSVEKVSFDDAGAFMHVVSSAEIARGVVPHKMVARAPTGNVIFERDVSVGLPGNGKAAGLKAPHPRPECA